MEMGDETEAGLETMNDAYEVPWDSNLIAQTLVARSVAAQDPKI
jgi:hypothetical protein